MPSARAAIFLFFFLSPPIILGNLGGLIWAEQIVLSIGKFTTGLISGTDEQHKPPINVPQSRANIVDPKSDNGTPLNETGVMLR